MAPRPAPPFEKILIANRGEIALRIIRACREMGIRTVAVYSQCDVGALHVRFADESVCIGPAEARLSYLNIPHIISAALITGADAIHPGYGFLAENPEFARVIGDHGMTFIGPPPEQIIRFGDKLQAKAAAAEAGVPLVPGSADSVSDPEEAVRIAREVGYPIILKAAAGGGGKGMRIVESDDELRRALPLASAEALAAFGNGAMFIERFLPAPRHIEVQVAGDFFGNAIHLGERDCSLQRRHQKILEEAPAAGLSDDLRSRIHSAAVELVRAAGYRTVGTCEFLVQGEEFFFLEVNPRIQVEHPVTEEVSGVDLIQLQIRLAAGEEMPFKQEDIRIQGHAIEVRINAEHPFKLTPSPGRITGYHLPGGPGLRVDSSVCEQAFVQPYYDSLVAKLIVRAPDRASAIRKLEQALSESVVEGIHTNLPLHREVVASEEFRNLDFHTRFIDTWLKERG